jgi:hypothetical protein
MPFTNGIICRKPETLYQYGDGMLPSAAIGYYNVMCYTGAEGPDVTIYISWRSKEGSLKMYRYEFGDTVSYTKIVSNLINIKRGTSKKFGSSYGRWANWVKSKALFYVKVED